MIFKLLSNLTKAVINSSDSSVFAVSDLEMGRKVRKKIEKAPVDSASDDDVATPSRCSKKRKVLSDSDESDCGNISSLSNSKGQRSCNAQETLALGKKKKIRRCAESSDEENLEPESKVAMTPKAARELKLKKLMIKSFFCRQVLLELKIINWGF